MPVRNDGIICRECGGSGCESCNHTGYSYMRRQEAQQSADIPIVPMPYGKILPDLTGSHSVDDDWAVCPACGSNNVVCLDSKYNPWVDEENNTPSSRWFCISCQDSWCYEREH